MKRLAQMEVAFCDYCGKYTHYSRVCLKCGKDFCSDCEETQAVSYDIGIYYIQTFVYCLACDTAAVVSGDDKLRNVAQTIKNLRAEGEKFNDNYSKRVEQAQTVARELYNARRKEVKG